MSYSERRKARMAKTKAMPTKKVPPAEPTDAIGTLYAYLACREGDEGIVASMTPMGITPLVASRRSEVKMMGTMARKVADGSGEVVRLVAFNRGRVMDVFEPRPDPEGRMVPLGIPGLDAMCSPELVEEIAAVSASPDGYGRREGTINVVADGGLVRVETSSGIGLAFAADTAREVARMILAEVEKIDGEGRR